MGHFPGLRASTSTSHLPCAGQSSSTLVRAPSLHSSGPWSRRLPAMCSISLAGQRQTATFGGAPVAGGGPYPPFPGVFAGADSPLPVTGGTAPRGGAPPTPPEPGRGGFARPGTILTWWGGSYTLTVGASSGLNATMVPEPFFFGPTKKTRPCTPRPAGGWL